MSTAEAKFELNKLKVEYERRKDAVEEWEKARELESETGFLEPEDLKVLRKRVKSRLEHAKEKTDQYREVVKKLYKKYKEDYDERVINKDQYEQILTWARGKWQLSKERYTNFMQRVVDQYEITIK